MKKRIIVTVAALLLAITVTGFVFAGSKIELETELIFTGATSDTVVLSITNWSRKDITVSADGFYIDEVGSAGSWECVLQEPVTLGPRQARYLEFEIEKAASHGDNSILVFFFRHEGDWYLAKTGKLLGLEYYRQHN